MKETETSFMAGLIGLAVFVGLIWLAYVIGRWLVLFALEFEKGPVFLMILAGWAVAELLVRVYKAYKAS